MTTQRSQSQFSRAVKYRDKFDPLLDPLLLIAIPFILFWRAAVRHFPVGRRGGRA